MSDLKKQAEELGIDVDGRWSDKRLQDEIDKALGAPKAEDKPAPQPPAEKKIPVRINRDFWDEAGERHRKGQIVEVSVEAALDGAESGALSRVK
jgi:hypothetical protein